MSNTNFQSLRRQLQDLDLIARYSKDLRHSGGGLHLDTSIRLRADLRAPLSRRSGSLA